MTKCISGVRGGGDDERNDCQQAQLFRYTGATLGASSLTALGFSARPALAEFRAFKLARTTETRNPCTYCSVKLRGHHVRPRRQGEKRQVVDHPHRRRPRSPDQSRHALSKGRGAPRLHQGADAAPLSRISGAGFGRVETRIVGLGDDSYRPARQRGPRQEPSPKTRTGSPSTAGCRRVFSPPRQRPTKLPSSLTRSHADWGSSPSTTKQEFDTARRWPVWPQHSAAAR
jgi:hypothetical protein